MFERKITETTWHAVHAIEQISGQITLQWEHFQDLERLREAILTIWTEAKVAQQEVGTWQEFHDESVYPHMEEPGSETGKPVIDWERFKK